MDTTEPLTGEAIEAFRRDGFVFAPGFFDAAEMDGITGWIHGWKQNGWRTASKKPVKNTDLWQRLDAAQTRHRVTWEWVKGHAGHAQNERADELARAEIKALKERGEKRA